MFIVSWVFDKLGYMPKVDVQFGKVDINTEWPFPGENKDFFGIKRKKPIAKKTVNKATTRPKKK